MENKKLNGNNVAKQNNGQAKRPEKKQETPATAVKKPMNKFQRGVEEMKKFAESQSYEVVIKENSKKIFFNKDTSDGLRSELIVIPMGADSWIIEAKVLQPVKNKATGKVVFVQKNFNKFDRYSTRATRDVIKLYA